jgi:hypothetical protein
MTIFKTKTPSENGLNRETECFAEHKRHKELKNDFDRENRFITRNDKLILSDSFTNNDKSELSVDLNEYSKPSINQPAAAFINPHNTSQAPDDSSLTTVLNYNLSRQLSNFIPIISLFTNSDSNSDLI